jgi:transposase InsO family protein
VRFPPRCTGCCSGWGRHACGISTGRRGSSFATNAIVPELVHVDVKKQGRIPDGGGWRVHGFDSKRGSRAKKGAGYDFIHAAVDDRSRVAYAEILPDERKETASAFVTRAFGFFAERGIPVERVLTDNGSCYRSREFARTLAAAGVAHRRTRPYRPQTNGKVERFNLTLKWEWPTPAPTIRTTHGPRSSCTGSTPTTTIDPTWHTPGDHRSRRWSNVTRATPT